jgi:tetratricopeptide (TPR) repeat protein
VSESPVERGRAALAAGRYEDAVRIFGEAVRLSPSDDGLRYHLASALLWRGRPADALSVLDPCIALRGAWLPHALELAVAIRRQLGLPVHGQMILPGARPVAMSTSPTTTLTGSDAGPSFIAAADRLRALRKSS